MKLDFYRWKKDYWVIYDEERKPGDGAKSQNFLFYNLYPIFCHLATDRLKLDFTTEKTTYQYYHLRIREGGDVVWYDNLTNDIHIFPFEARHLKEVFGLIPTDIYINY